MVICFRSPNDECPQLTIISRLLIYFISFIFALPVVSYIYCRLCLTFIAGCVLHLLPVVSYIYCRFVSYIYCRLCPKSWDPNHILLITNANLRVFPAFHLVVYNIVKIYKKYLHGLFASIFHGNLFIYFIYQLNTCTVCCNTYISNVRHALQLTFSIDNNLIL